LNKIHPFSLRLVKNKLYTSLIFLIGIGFAFAPTISYAKPIHSKQVSASNKSLKKTSRHSSGRNKASKNKLISKATYKHKTSKSRSLYSSRKINNRFASISHKNTYLSQNDQGELFLEPTSSNERIHTLIGNQHTDTPIKSSIHPSDEAPAHINSVHGTINSSLTTAGQNAGLSNDLIEQLTNIFAWDIDFATNLSQGDQFTVVYEQSSSGDNSSGAQIIAAEFVNRGRILTAIRYKNSEGNVNFYSPEGKPMRKAFLSAPVDYLRISSGFSSHRKHPILNRIRAHKGIDYAARTGTPVKSAGDGEVVFLGNKGGYGQLLIIKHGDHYETVYAHLSNFKKGLESGSQVKQGDVIGYVGQTGLATGPHLHYEFRVDGAHQNPEALNMAQTLPLHAEILADFKNQTRTTLAQLNKTKAQSLFAKNQYNYN